MGNFIWQEINLFLQSAYYGMILGLSYDILRVFRRIFKHKNILVYIEDYIFWVIWGVILFSLMFTYNDGSVRGYIFVAIVVGGLLYEKSFSRILVKYVSLILNKILSLVLKKPLKAVRIVLIKVVRLIKKGIVKINGCFKKKKKEEE